MPEPVNTVRPLRRRRLARWAALAAISAGGAALALPAAAITQSTATDAFDAVGRGVQVAPSWVLTVAHAALGVGQTYGNGYGSWLVAARYLAPGAAFPANDLALLRLQPAVAGAPYLALSADAVAAGSVSFAATIASAANTSGPRAYAFTAIAESLATLDPDGPGGRGEVPVNYLVSWDSRVHVDPGDSGGALFQGHVTDAGLLVGLTSARFDDDQGQAVGSAFVQPAAWRDWIDATMAADGADDQRLLWVSAVPEPGAASLAIAGLPLLLLARRRRARRA